jgi:hypothetical protein
MPLAFNASRRPAGGPSSGQVWSQNLGQQHVVVGPGPIQSLQFQPNTSANRPHGYGPSHPDPAVIARSGNTNSNTGNANHTATAAANNPSDSGNNAHPAAIPPNPAAKLVDSPTFKKVIVFLVFFKLFLHVFSDIIFSPLEPEEISPGSWTVFDDTE